MEILVRKFSFRLQGLGTTTRFVRHRNTDGCGLDWVTSRGGGEGVVRESGVAAWETPQSERFVYIRPSQIWHHNGVHRVV